MKDAVTARRRRVFGRFPDGAGREEAALDELIAGRKTSSRANTIAVLSPNGEVGQTTCTFLLGNLLASATRLRCVAVDASADSGTLGALVPGSSRSPGSLADVFARMDEIDSAVELRSLVATLPTGLHLIEAPPHAEAMAAITPERLGLLTDFLGRFYDVILLDLGTDIGGPLARFALEQADQSVVVSTPDFAAVSTVLGAVRYLRGRNLTVVLNQAPRLPSEAARREIEDELRGQEIHQHVIVPYDDRLRAMLDSASYDLSALDRDTRMSIKQLGLSSTRWLAKAFWDDEDSR